MDVVATSISITDLDVIKGMGAIMVILLGIIITQIGFAYNRILKIIEENKMEAENRLTEHKNEEIRQCGICSTRNQKEHDDLWIEIKERCLLKG